MGNKLVENINHIKHDRKKDNLGVVVHPAFPAPMRLRQEDCLELVQGQCGLHNEQDPVLKKIHMGLGI